MALCNWRICHQTHVFCGRTTFVPNQIRYQMNTVPMPAAAWTRVWLLQGGGGGTCVLAGEGGDRCCRPRRGDWGSVTLSPLGEIQARITQPPGHKDKPPGRPTTAVARGRVGLKVRLGGPTLVDCRAAQVVLPIGGRQRPRARVNHRGSWRGPRVSPCVAFHPISFSLRGHQHSLGGPSAVLAELLGSAHPLPGRGTPFPPSTEHEDPCTLPSQNTTSLAKWPTL